jgi:GTP-binding protein Era
MTFRCGTVAIVGRPNVGKSTLLNRLIGAKVSITSRKPQTTRHQIRGILTTDDAQFVFVDTPGFQTKHGGPLNRTLNRAVQTALADVDVVLVVVAAGPLGAADRTVLELIPADRPLVVVVNKIDSREGAREILPVLKAIGEAVPRAEVVPVSARTGRNVEKLVAVVRERLPEQPAIFDPDEITDRDERFLAAEMIREKLFRSLGEEVPYGSVVVVESFKQEGDLRRIHANIIVDREGHKAIVVGKGGERMKQIASAARIDMEKLFGGKVFLEVWVKVVPGWSGSQASLRRFGLG